MTLLPSHTLISPPLRDRLCNVVATALLMTFAPLASTQDLPREFAMLNARDLTLACTVHTTFLATTAAQSADAGTRATATNLVRLALVWKREASREQTSQVETLDWRRRVEALGSEQIREQTTYCAKHAAMMFSAMPATLQRTLREEAEQQASRLRSSGKN